MVIQTNIVYYKSIYNMVSSLSEIPEKAHFAMQIIDSDNKRVTQDIQNDIENVFLNNFEFVFSYGTGSNKQLSRSEYGYIVPDSSMWAKEFTNLENQLNEQIPDVNIEINVLPLILSEENFDAMRQVGDRKGLGALQDFVDEMNK